MSRNTSNIQKKYTKNGALLFKLDPNDDQIAMTFLKSNKAKQE